VGSTPSAWALHVPFVATTVMESRTYGGFAPSQELDVRLLTNGDVIVAQGGSQKVVGQLPKSRVREIQKTIEGLREEKLMLENPNAVGCQDAPSTTYIAYTEEGLSVRLGERINCLLTRNMDFQGSKLLDVLFGLEKMAAL
jgi:hypothetical protein